MGQPHAPHLTLLFDALRHVSQLWYKVTDERVDLPPPVSGHRWALHFNEQGFGHLHDGVTCMWASSVLRTSLHKSPDGSFFLRTGSESRWLRDVLSVHHEHHIKADLENTKLDIIVYRFDAG